MRHHTDDESGRASARHSMWVAIAAQQDGGHRRRHGGPEGPEGRGGHFGPGGRGERGERGGRGAGRPGRGPGGPGGPGRGAEEPAAVSTEAISAWLAGRLPDGWFTAAAEVTVDRDEITVVGILPAPEISGSDGAAVDAPAVAEAEAGRLSRFREETRETRMAIAREAEHRYGRSVAWGAVAGGSRTVFSNLSVPVMTRLRQPDRQVLDTLVDAGVARSRSDALAWCVRLVGRHSEEWLGALREAMTEVERVRAEGPGA